MPLLFLTSPSFSWMSELSVFTSGQGNFNRKSISNKGFIRNVINFLIMGGKTIRSFNAEAEVNDLINESGIKKGEMSSWINDKIKKGILYDKNPTLAEPKQLQNVEVEL